MMRNLTLALLLSGCSMIAAGKASTSSKPSTPTAPTTAATPEALGETSDEIENPRKQTLENLAKRIEAGDMAMYALESHREHSKLAFMEDRWRDPPQDKLVAERLAVLDAAAYKKYPRVAANVGDGARVREADPDAIDAAKKMIAACQAVASIRGSDDMTKELADKMAVYEKEIARVKKLDPTAFHYLGENVDIPADMLSCEHGIAQTSGYAEDRYVPETAPQAANEKRCAMVDFLIDGVQIRGGNFAPYTRTVGGRQAMEELACKKLAKKSKYPKPMAAAVKEFADDIGLKLSEMAIVVKGKPYVEEDEDDGRLHRYQILTAYSKNFEFSGNPCGKGKTFCEAGGSRGAQAYNMAEFALERAAAHAGNDVDKCKKFLEETKSRAEWFVEFRADAIKSKSWITGATYKTKKGELLPEAKFVAAFAKLGKDAEDKLDNKFCRQPK
jgi:hypothetical protein